MRGRDVAPHKGFSVASVACARGPEGQAYMAAALWPQGIQGVLTHDTALDLWDVSDVNPAKIHITVRADTARSERSPGHT